MTRGVEEVSKQSILTDRHRKFLDDLRDSGKCNMIAAGSYVQREFGVSGYEAKDIILTWMRGVDNG